MRREVTLLLACAMLAGCGAAQPPVGRSPGAQAAAQLTKGSERILYSFTGGNDGGDPAADLVFDATGKLYGTTVIGGAASCGTIFTLTPHTTPPWQESVLYNFTCYSDGKNPYGGVTFDTLGDMYGTTVSGGAGGSCGSTGCGVAWELKGAQESVLHAFSGGMDGFGPGNGIAADAHGNLYGTTPDGGKNSEGTVYELYKRAGAWHERVLHAFTGGTDGAGGMLGRLLIDQTGTIYGVAEGGGANSAGTVYRLRPKSKGGFRFTTLYAFKGTPDCADPYGGLYETANGTLYGTTYYGGSNGLGCIFSLAATGSEKALYSFKGGTDGSNPSGTLVFVSTNNVSDFYGTTSMGGGSCNCGTIFSLNEKTNQETVRHAFTGGSDGAYPYYGLAADASTRGPLYGTTAAGGSSNQGTIFEFKRH